MHVRSRHELTLLSTVTRRLVLDAVSVVMAVAVPATLSTSCVGDGGGVVLVELRTDLVPGVDLDGVRTELTLAMPGVDASAPTLVVDLPVAEGADFSRAVRVAELEAVPVGVYHLSVRAMHGTDTIAERVLLAEVRNNTAFRVVLSRRCRGVRCPRAGDTATSCVGGVCTQPACVSGRELSCPPRECAEDGDCAAVVSCASSVCVDGLCLQQTDDALCATGERCYPDIGCLDAGSCVPLTEICNGVDDDCDTLVDEGFDLSTDSENCGSCGMRCGGANATASCSSSVCAIACNPGFADCNDNAEDGCETSLNSASSCGACGMTCPASASLCESMACTDGCSAGHALCDGACIDTTSNVDHCGSCATVCTASANAAPTCVAGVCGQTCAAGFGACRGPSVCTPLNTNTDCGGCGVVCARANATSTCAAGVCMVQSCNARFGDCDANDVNGCETPLNTLTDCGACGATCALPHVISTCDAGCHYGMCDADWADCDRDATNGCERNTATDTSNCGGCGVSCGAGETCTGGVCACGRHMGEVGEGHACTEWQKCCPGEACRPVDLWCP